MINSDKKRIGHWHGNQTSIRTADWFLASYSQGVVNASWNMNTVQISQTNRHQISQLRTGILSVVIKINIPFHSKLWK